MLKGEFRKKNIGFDLQAKLDEISAIMRSKAMINKVNFSMVANFDTGHNLLNQMKKDDLQSKLIIEDSSNSECYSTLVRQLALKGRLEDLNTMLNYVPASDSTQYLPKFLIGDPDRF